MYIFGLLFVISLFNLCHCLNRKTLYIKKLTNIKYNLNKISTTTALFATDKFYSIPNQPVRVANAKASNNARFLNIDSVYNPEYIKGKRVLVTGSLFNY